MLFRSGDSIGRWEGNTLVVDTTNFSDKMAFERYRITEAMHVVERFTRTGPDAIRYQFTVEDPGVLAKPWTFKRTAELGPTETIREFMCSENNRDLEHLVGK